MSLGAKKNGLRSGVERKEKERRDEKIGWPASEESSFRRLENKATPISLPEKNYHKSDN